MTTEGHKQASHASQKRTFSKRPDAVVRSHLGVKTSNFTYRLFFHIFRRGGLPVLGYREGSCLIKLSTQTPLLVQYNPYCTDRGPCVYKGRSNRSRLTASQHLEHCSKLRLTWLLAASYPQLEDKRLFDWVRWSTIQMYRIENRLLHQVHVAPLS